MVVITNGDNHQSNADSGLSPILPIIPLISNNQVFTNAIDIFYIVMEATKYWYMSFSCSQYKTKHEIDLALVEHWN